MKDTFRRFGRAESRRSKRHDVLQVTVTVNDVEFECRAREMRKTFVPLLSRCSTAKQETERNKNINRGPIVIQFEGIFLSTVCWTLFTKTIVSFGIQLSFFFALFTLLGEMFSFDCSFKLMAISAIAKGNLNH
jgi:hypothetical protein